MELHNYMSIQCRVCGHVHYLPVYCGDRFCPICSKSRMLRIRNRLSDLVKSSKLKNNENFRHLVLTISSQKSPASMVKFLVACFRKLRNRKIFQQNFSGGAYVIEFTQNRELWHAHLHVIVQGKYIPQSALLTAWREIAGKAGVFIKTIPKKAIIHYLTKYMTKISMVGKAKDKVLEALKGLRLFICFGSWHDLLPSWTKIPYQCTDCGSSDWRDFDRLMEVDGDRIDEIFNERYGCG